MKRCLHRHVVTAAVLLVAMLCQVTWALAGTTGGLSGVAVDADTGAPVAGATVTVSAPSQSATAATDAGGRFTFLTLAPDTYTVTVNKGGYQEVSEPGQIVFADTVQTVTVRLTKALKTIARVTALGAGAIVKSGTTADVYSVNAATQGAAGALGGGGSLNSAYSAIATVPGAYVVGNQAGYFQTVSIRGGDYDQVGYEFDGVPVNRSFDNYPSSSASSLGNAEVQVYTGANPANSEGQGLAGYINQVIKTGTYPGYAEANLGIGTPAFYHQASVQVGGATPDRNFSYYVGLGGYNQDLNYIDNNNGSSYDAWLGQPLGLYFFSHGPAGLCNDPSQFKAGSSASDFTNCYRVNGGFGGFGPGGYALGSFNYGMLGSITQRDSVANVHIGIPHKKDAGKDDVQVLFDSSYLLNSFYTSPNDIVSPSYLGQGNCTGLTGVQCANAIGLGTPVYLAQYQLTCGPLVGHTFSQGGLAAQHGCVTASGYPSSYASPNTPIPATTRDTATNNQDIVKLQYTKNIGSTSFLRLYGYTYYSAWLQFGPNCAYTNVAAWGTCGTSPDYELSSHTRGVSANYQNQFNAQNLFGAQVSYTTADSIRDNNTQMFNAGGSRSRAAFAVNAADPLSGYCFAGSTTSATTSNPVACGAGATNATWADINGGLACGGAITSNCVAPLPTNKNGAANCGIPGKPQFGTACTYLLAENSLWATYNNIIPQFLSTSLTDEFRPSDRWLFNLGVRLDDFTFLGMNTNQQAGGLPGGNPNYAAVRNFWYTSYNLSNCISTTGVIVGRSPGAACPSGYKPAALNNVAQQNFNYQIYQPRIAGTYTVNPDNVIRFSFGRYVQAPNSAFEQYNQLAEDLPNALLGPIFYPYGRNSPGLPVYPATSLNYDVSWESHLKGTDWSFKLTPFLRQTQGQIQTFFINQPTSFISGLNSASQRSQGLEMQVQKGDFSRNGISGILAFAYTNSYVKYGTLTNGTNVITPSDAAIANYNAYTKACAAGGNLHGQMQYGLPLCGSTSNGLAAAPCYTQKGTPDPACKAGDVANPYWNVAGQSLINPAENFPTYSIFPGGIGSSGAAFGAPYVATLLLNYKHDKFAITPSFQFQGGGRYGYPISTPGIDPAAGGCQPLGGPFGNRYSAPTCNATMAIPDTYTGQFDNLGSFLQPNEFTMNLQLSYDVSPRLSLTGVLANIVNNCWGGTAQAWTYANGQVCGFAAGGFAGTIFPVGNVYNPGDHIQSFVKYPYQPLFGPFNQNGNSTKTPFNFYVTAKIKI
ncbi:MAG: TonB-dependent receptor [Candidatus Eremiobacteraeota bacterium]|nr:TonB-dependent receptor [Candidatus Eremiobacteraeota bacterium]